MTNYRDYLQTITPSKLSSIDLLKQEIESAARAGNNSLEYRVYPVFDHEQCNFLSSEGITCHFQKHDRDDGAWQDFLLSW